MTGEGARRLRAREAFFPLRPAGRGRGSVGPQGPEALTGGRAGRAARPTAPSAHPPWVGIREAAAHTYLRSQTRWKPPRGLAAPI